MSHCFYLSLAFQVLSVVWLSIAAGAGFAGRYDAATTWMLGAIFSYLSHMFWDGKRK